MKVYCPHCNKPQEDEGTRNACRKCWFQPIPSYAYPESSAFHPKPVEKGETVNQLYKQLKTKRKGK